MIDYLRLAAEGIGWAVIGITLLTRWDWHAADEYRRISFAGFGIMVVRKDARLLTSLKVIGHTFHETPRFAWTLLTPRWLKAFRGPQ